MSACVLGEQYFMQVTDKLLFFPYLAYIKLSSEQPQASSVCSTATSEHVSAQHCAATTRYNSAMATQHQGHAENNHPRGEVPKTLGLN